MFKRSDVRLVGYRMKAGVDLVKPHLLEIIPHLEEAMADEDTWEGFAEYWDVIVTPEKIIRVATENDEIFINDFCISLRTKLEMGIELEKIVESFSARELNLYEIVKINYLGESVDWSEYKKSWTVNINREYNRLEVLNLKTDRKVVEIPKPENTTLKKAIKDTVTEEDTELLAKIKALLGKD